jgi:hypothetical protein
MAQLRGFNANDVDPHKGFDPIPSGVYTCAIVESTAKPTKNQKGQLLELVVEVLEGPHKGRKVWDNLMLAHAESDKAVEVGLSILSAICRAVGVMQPRDTNELHCRPMRVTIGLKRREDSGDYQNIIRKYEAPAAPIVLGQTGDAQAAQAAAPESANPVAPWTRDEPATAGNALTLESDDERDDVPGEIPDDDDTPI